MSKYSDPYLLDHLKSIKFKSILEVGCGDGVNLKAAQKIHPHIGIAGCDILEGGIIWPKSKVCDVTKKLPYKDKSFDIVLVAAVLMICENYDIGEVMKELARIAKKEIILIEPIRHYQRIIERSISFKRIEFTLIPNWPWPNKGISGQLIVIKL